ncbi:MAG: hypothetical protein IPQ13_13470 [Holophagaceae bacterium]|nr:hypothetical protein [Holophagaceae bacterium]
MIRLRNMLLAIGLGILPCTALLASDPPHDTSRTVECKSCHTLHASPGATLTAVAGNANLCMSCHVPGGTASAKPFGPLDQADAAPGLPAGTAASGNSHRWDAGPAGRAVKGTPNTSTGTVMPLGAFTGAYAKTYTLTITTAGNVGGAQFSWTATSPGGGSGTGLTTGPSVLLDQGVSVKFADGTGTSFLLGDKWNIIVRAAVRAPADPTLASRLENGQMMCSTCHDQHIQANMPFDPAARTGGLKHFQRVANDADQMCVDCHIAHDQTSSTGGSHPVGVVVPVGNYKAPTTVPLDATNKVRCQSCHKVHYAPVSNGTLQRVASQPVLCADCHTNSDLANGIHYSATQGVLWPGDDRHTPASAYPAITDTAKRGACSNCHSPHGWPDAANTATKYPKLLVAANDNNFCFVCHDGTPTKDVLAPITKAIGHSTDPTKQVAGRAVSCIDCHNMHKAGLAHTYATTATATRNAIGTGALQGVTGVTVTFGAANWTAATFGTPATASKEYQICMKCHTSTSFGANPPAGRSVIYSTGTANFTAGGTTVAAGSTAPGWPVSSASNTALVGAWIRKNSDATTAWYRITASTATSLTITPAYAGATQTNQAYQIAQETDVSLEFNPANASFHPVAAGLNSGTGNGTPKALTTAQMKAPWNSSANIGTQTMMCSDCHNTDSASPAAQGPHGSATQFMLRGPQTLWPPTGNFNGATLYNTTFCSNCHTYTSNNRAHAKHTGRTVTCYNCHILVPHGGKLARLIGDGDSTTFPARYAYQNKKTNMWVTGFTKAAPGSYSETDCGASCATGKHLLTNGADW